MLICFLFSPIALAAAHPIHPAGKETREFKPVQNFRQVESIVDAKIDQYGGKSVLVVFDTDDTLLTMQSDLGSVSWFDWQHAMLKQDKKHPQLVSDNFAGLLNAQHAIFLLSSMKLTSTRIPATLNRWQEKDVRLLVETARGPEMAAATEQHMVRNRLGHNNADNALPLFAKTTPYFQPDDETNPEPISMQTCSALNTDKLRYQHGVLYVSGQNKAIALNCLLTFADHTPKALIFVDDSTQNLHHVLEYFGKGDQIESVTAVHYKKLSQHQADFHQDQQRQQQADKSWRQLRP